MHAKGTQTMNDFSIVHNSEKYTVTQYECSAAIKDHATQDVLMLGADDAIELEYQSILADGYSDSLVRSFWHIVQVNNH